MPSLVTWFDPQPAAAELPARMPSPFDHGVHPLARRAAAALRAQLAATAGAWGLDQPGGGKMLGVLVVAAADGRVGFLRGFSGMVGGRWHVDGFVPPLFDERARDAVWRDGEDELCAMARAIDALAASDERAAADAALADLEREHAAARAALADDHQRRRAARHAERARLAAVPPPERARQEALAALARASQGDRADHRRLEAAQRARRAAAVARVDAVVRAREALEAARAARSRELLVAIHDAYVVPAATGARRPLRELFAPAEPPGGAGDCAAPKLLAHAFRAGLRPLALAEVWCGAPPRTGDRRDGAFYPACRGKCGPLLAHMLDGLAVEPAPQYGAAPVADHEPAVVHADAWLVVVDKPCGLLAVPGRSGLLRDSVLTRLRRRDPDASGPRIVHRLDLDTSGLMLVARDAATHAALQRQFARREVAKRYAAWLDGEVRGERGTIELALRVDLDDRPRQLHDPVHGKAAVTAWQVVARTAVAGRPRTRVALTPHTGRTHQLRVHAAHPAGLDAPIVGDRLYGRDVHDGGRLQLHAEALAFTHPRTGQRLAFERPAPF